MIQDHLEIAAAELMVAIEKLNRARSEAEAVKPVLRLVTPTHAAAPTVVSLPVVQMPAYQDRPRIDENQRREMALKFGFFSSRIGFRAAL